MAKNLVAAGHRVLGVDVSSRARQSAAARGIDVVEDLSDAVAATEAVFTMLPKGEHVRSVLEGEDGVLAHARREALVVDTSTVEGARAAISRSSLRASVARSLVVAQARAP